MVYDYFDVQDSTIAPEPKEVFTNAAEMIVAYGCEVSMNTNSAWTGMDAIDRAADDYMPDVNSCNNN